jgi:hypothetical protein
VDGWVLLETVGHAVGAAGLVGGKNAFERGRPAGELGGARAHGGEKGGELGVGQGMDGQVIIRREGGEPGHFVEQVVRMRTHVHRSRRNNLFVGRAHDERAGGDQPQDGPVARVGPRLGPQ